MVESQESASEQLLDAWIDAEDGCKPEAYRPSCGRLNIAGIVLQVIGVAVAIAGVSRLHRDLTSRSVGDALRADIVEKWRAWRTRKHAVVIAER